MSTDVAIIGAGIAGLSAARTLRRAGLSVAIVDKGRGVGGRLATRRIGDARLDHGAQFFTVRGEDFATLVNEAIEADVVEVWCHGFSSEDGYPRYSCPGGMTGLAKWLAADLASQDVEITLERRVESIAAHVDQRDETVWALRDNDDTLLTARHVIVTAPVPQALDLFDASHIAPSPTVLEALRAISYHRVLGLLVALDGPPAIPEPGAVQSGNDAPFTFIADNVTKGVSQNPAVTFHANHALSAARWDDPQDEVIEDFLTLAQPWFGNAQVTHVELKKWLYAGPVTPYPDRSVTIVSDPGLIVLGGDAFGGPKVEGAFNSGTACAKEILPDR